MTKHLGERRPRIKPCGALSVYVLIVLSATLLRHGEKMLIRYMCWISAPFRSLPSSPSLSLPLSPSVCLTDGRVVGTALPLPLERHGACSEDPSLCFTPFPFPHSNFFFYFFFSTTLFLFQCHLFSLKLKDEIQAGEQVFFFHPSLTQATVHANLLIVFS